MLVTPVSYYFRHYLQPIVYQNQPAKFESQNHALSLPQHSCYQDSHGTAQATMPVRCNYNTGQSSENPKSVPRYDTWGPGKKPPSLEGLDEFIERERRRRDLWHHRFGFNGERASESEREAESQRRRDFERELQRRQNLTGQPNNDSRR